jgi:hypothetical protein
LKPGDDVCDKEIQVNNARRATENRLTHQPPWSKGVSCDKLPVEVVAGTCDNITLLPENKNFGG